MNTYINYIKGSTTFSTITGDIVEVDPFYIVLCVKEPRFKPSIIQKYPEIKSAIGYDTNWYDIPLNVSIWEMYQDITYEIGKDFTVDIKLVNWGENSNINAGLDFESIATYRNGMCTLIKPNISLPSNYGRFQINVNFSPNLNAENLPKTMKLAFTSAEGWHGFILDDWPDIKPDIFEIQIAENSTSFWYFKLTQTDYIFTKGTEGFTDCFMDHLEQQD